jgi:N-carbamoylputrescine amidase
MDVTLSLAAIQMSMSDRRIDNVSTAERLVRQAASNGARIILIPELFEGEYFCKEHDAQHQQLLMRIPLLLIFKKLLQN